MENKILKSGLITVILGALLFASACATSAEQPTGGGFDWTFIVIMAALFGVFYFLMIRPQQKKQKQQQRMLEDLKKGDKIITAGGMFGTIESVDDDTMIVRVESGTTIRMLKNSVMVKREAEEPEEKKEENKF